MQPREPPAPLFAPRRPDADRGRPPRARQVRAGTAEQSWSAAAASSAPLHPRPRRAGSPQRSRDEERAGDEKRRQRVADVRQARSDDVIHAASTAPPRRAVCRGRTASRIIAEIEGHPPPGRRRRRRWASAASTAATTGRPMAAEGARTARAAVAAGPRRAKACGASSQRHVQRACDANTSQTSRVAGRGAERRVVEHGFDALVRRRPRLVGRDHAERTRTPALATRARRVLAHLASPQRAASTELEHALHLELVPSRVGLGILELAVEKTARVAHAATRERHRAQQPLRGRERQQKEPHDQIDRSRLVTLPRIL